MAAPYSKYRSNLRTTRPSLKSRTTLRALKRLPIPWKKEENSLQISRKEENVPKNVLLYTTL